MAAIQLSFTLRTSTNCKTVHLLGSWDGYKGQLPLSKTEKAGGWKGTFKFQGATIQPGQRYWFYYIIDGYHVSHDPSREHVVEPTTSRKLNVLDIPGKPGSGKASARENARNEKRSSVAKGRGVSPSKIVSPKPVHPSQAARALVRGDYSKDPRVAEIARRLAAARMDAASSDEEDDEDSEIESDADSDVPSLTSRSSRSSGSSSPSSVSSTSSCCTCERYGITRGGDRVKLDCGGARCGYSDGSECSSESEDEYRARTTRRQGLVVGK